MEELSRAKIKQLKNLKVKKCRYSSGLFAVEGLKFVREALCSGFHVEFVAIARHKVDSILPDIKTVSGDVPVFSIPSSSRERIFSTSTPQGIIAVVRIPESVYLLLDGSARYEVQDSDISCLLFEINDPGNLGTIIRSAHWFGIRRLFLYKCADPFSSKVLRASAGSIL